jgi:predicted GIY-YIG superfamily endonuclease
MATSTSAEERRGRGEAARRAAWQLGDALRYGHTNGHFGQVRPKFAWVRSGMSPKWHRVDRGVATWHEDKIVVAIATQCSAVITRPWFNRQAPEPTDGRLCLACLDDTNRFAIYRAYDALGELLYIGYTTALPERIKAHGRTSHWFDDVARWTHELFPTAVAALEAEASAISTENPIYNRWRPVAA